MPDEGGIFEGDNTNEINQHFIQDLDLFNLSNKFKKFWKLPERNNLYTAIFIMVSKGLPFETYNKIMENMHKSLGVKFTVNSFNFSDKKLKEWGLSNDKISGIRKILEIAKTEEITPKNLCRVKEGGIYLYKSFKILQEEDDDCFLFEDYIVRRNLSILFYKDKIMTTTEAKDISVAWRGHRSQISYFLSKLKESGVVKILDDEPLEEYDFIGYDDVENVSSSSSSSKSENNSTITTIKTKLKELKMKEEPKNLSSKDEAK
jgi:hypothetical protein